MRYPDPIIKRYGTAARFAEAAAQHPLAPTTPDGERKTLTEAAIYQWKQRDVVPFMWRPVVIALASRHEAAQ
jgi:hypothetical protein